MILRGKLLLDILNGKGRPDQVRGERQWQPSVSRKHTHLLHETVAASAIQRFGHVSLLTTYDQDT